ncbi:MAG: DUF4338 domain-containing protein [bacterium]|nr:DUF4338 domain-containing protein [bacterium]
MRYCGRDFSAEELDLIRRLIREDPSRTRNEISRRVCRALNWLKPDGGLKDMSCRVALLRMQAGGLIQLPPPRRKKPENRIPITPATEPKEPILLPVHALPPLRLRQVGQVAQARLWNEYIQRYHYLGHQPLPGAQLRYFVFAEEHLLALLGFGAAAWQTAPRDRFIGWSHEQRQRNLHLIVNNARFLVLPWVQSQNLASKILATAVRQLPDDWQRRYAYRPVLLETFVEQSRFIGTSYKAANWIPVGQTQGRGKLGPAGKLSVPIKDLWLYPLVRDFKQLLTCC